MAVNHVVYGGNTLIDLRNDTVTSAEHIMSGYVGHLADGTVVTGTGGGSVTWETLIDQNITIESSSPNYFIIDNYTTPFNADETYRVTWGSGGTEHICQTTALSASQVYDGYVIGNLGIVGGTDTGEPFLMYRDSATRLLCATNQSAGLIHVTIERQQSGSTNQDYEDALTAFGVQSNLASGITALTTYANEITGESDTTLSDAVRSLADGYGQGGSSLPPWIPRVETVTIGANTVTNTNGAKTYFNSYTPYFAVALKTAPTTNNQILALVNNAASALRYRNGAVVAVGVTNSYDAKLVEGTQYEVWHYGIPNGD